MFADLNFIYYG